MFIEHLLSSTATVSSVLYASNSFYSQNNYEAAAAAAKLLQLCPTLCDPIDVKQGSEYKSREQDLGTQVSRQKEEIPQRS